MIMLDTNIVSHAMKFSNGVCGMKMRELGSNNCFISVIVVGELRFGAKKKGSYRLTQHLESMLSALNIVPISDNITDYYARIRTDLESRGLIIGQNDLWIAAHAMSLDAKLVTDNMSEFERIKILKLENWLK